MATALSLMDRYEAIESKEREAIEASLERELGFRWTPQMRHGFKAWQMWVLLVLKEARYREEVGPF